MRAALYLYSNLAWAAVETTFYNPILPGWHPDPSCIFVADANNTLFCTTSSLVVFPSLPIYASTDFRTWTLVSHALHHPHQYPDFGDAARPDQGFFESTLRYRDGQYYLITGYFSSGDYTTLLFRTFNPSDESGWGMPLQCTTIGYDPDLFWDEDGAAYLTAVSRTSGGIIQAPINLMTGEIGQPYFLWNGTGGLAEGPHLFSKDGFYYLTIAEGGVSVEHRQTIARSKTLRGPFISYSGNPILTNWNTSSLFQAVGHMDVFQTADGAWFAVACAVRSGPEWANFPMGRETVLSPLVWETGQWPRLSSIRGIMDSSTLPPRSDHGSPGQNGSDRGFVDSADVIEFEPGSRIPRHLVHWGLPDPSDYTVSPEPYPYSLRLRGSRANLSSQGAEKRTLIMRRQTHSLFSFQVDIQFSPAARGDEAGVTVFLSPQQYLGLGVGCVEDSTCNSSRSLLFRVTNLTETTAVCPLPPVLDPAPKSQQERPIRLKITAVNETTYRFTAGLSSGETGCEHVFYGSASVVSGGAGIYSGTSYTILCWDAGDNPK
jgi:beta-xylosidase